VGGLVGFLGGKEGGCTFEANMVAVTLRQSAQWQMWVFIRSGPSMGCERWRNGLVGSFDYADRVSVLQSGT
jgi:hypothetical protein